jgi:hypothetical protein
MHKVSWSPFVCLSLTVVAGAFAGCSNSSAKGTSPLDLPSDIEQMVASDPVPPPCDALDKGGYDDGTTHQLAQVCLAWRAALHIVYDEQAANGGPEADPNGIYDKAALFVVGGMWSHLDETLGGAPIAPPGTDTSSVGP